MHITETAQQPVTYHATMDDTFSVDDFWNDTTMRRQPVVLTVPDPVPEPIIDDTIPPTGYDEGNGVIDEDHQSTSAPSTIHMPVTAEQRALGLHLAGKRRAPLVATANSRKRPPPPQESEDDPQHRTVHHPIRFCSIKISCTPK